LAFMQSEHVVRARTGGGRAPCIGGWVWRKMRHLATSLDLLAAVARCRILISINGPWFCSARPFHSIEVPKKHNDSHLSPQKRPRVFEVLIIPHRPIKITSLNPWVQVTSTSPPRRGEGLKREVARITRFWREKPETRFPKIYVTNENRCSASIRYSLCNSHDKRDAEKSPLQDSPNLDLVVTS